jgi:amino acid adenylation domain-containing protein
MEVAAARLMNHDRTSGCTLVHHLQAQAGAAAQRTVFRFADGDTSTEDYDYARLDIEARRLAAGLQARGLQGERAVLMHAPGPGYVIALLGCFYAGVVAVPAYPPRFNRPMERLRDLVADARARLALTTAAALQGMQPHIGADATLAGLEWLATDTPAALGAARDWRMPGIDAGSLALLQYTSGSTSAPKGVMISHGNFHANVLAITGAVQATGDDRLVSWLPPYHDMGLVAGLLGPLYLGIDTLLLSPSSFLQRPLRWLQAISRHRATISGAPNFAYELCARRVTDEQLAQLDLGSWRIAFCGAERVRAGTLQQFARRFAPARFRPGAFVPSYGLAEATLGVACGAGGLQCADAESRTPLATVPADPDPALAARLSVSCGRALPGVGVHVVDAATLQALPDGTVGELWVQGPSVAAGYWGRPELTAQVFGAHIAGGDGTPQLRTGDLGFMLDGQVHVLGRLKDLIILRGANVHPEDVESAIEGVHPALRPAGAAAFGVERDGEEQLVVVQELNPGRHDIDLDAAATALRDAVARALQLPVWQVLLVPAGEVPRTSSGKVRRGSSRERYLAGELEVIHTGNLAAASAAQASPEAVLQVAQMMAVLLGIERMAPDDDFLRLGGHSLLVTQLVSRVRGTLGIELPLATVFAAPTPRRLAAAIAALPADAARPDIRPVARDGRLPLTFSQERMWLLHKMDPQGTAYNVAGAARVRGHLDAALLAQAINAVIRTHEVLRTRYLTTAGGEVELRVAGPAPLALPLHDLAAGPDPEAQALRLARQLASTPFDIAAGPLLRAQLCRTGEDEHVLSVCMHHLVTDAWSMGILVRELLQAYQDLRAGRAPGLQVPATGYIDYAGWQRRHFAGPQAAAQLQYWRHELRGAEAVELPTDRPRSLQRTSAGELEPLALPAPLMDAVAGLAQAHGATPFMVLLAAFEALLFRWTGRSDLVVGVPVANRNWAESEALMGTLVNTLPVRVGFDAQRSFSELLQVVRERSLEAFAHQDLPFEKLIAELQLERKAGASPLVSVMFDYQNAPMPGGSASGVTLEPLMVARGSAQFDLSLLILDNDFGRVAGVEYSTDLFDAPTIRSLLGHYLALLEAVVLDPSVPVARLPMLRDSEQRELLARAQQACHAGARAPELVHQLEAGFAAHGDALAVEDARGALSYGQLHARVRSLAARLQARGAGPGDRIAVCLERGTDLVVALLAVLRTGAAYVPLDPNYPAERLGYILQDAQPDLLLTGTRLGGLAQHCPGLPLLCLDEPSRARDAQDPVAPVVDCDEALPAYILYTSGSTGRPKGVVVSRGALANFVAAMRNEPGITPADRLLAVTTVAFDISGLEIFLPLAAGASVYVAGSDVVADGPRLLKLLQEWRATFMQATPATWKILVEAGWRGHPGFKVLCGGEAFPRELATQLLERAGSVWNMYGPTETTIWSTVGRVQPGVGALVPIGTPIAETSVYVLDAHRQLVPRGVSGEIWIGGLGVADGYHGQPGLTAERFTTDPFMDASRAAHARLYRTGDAGRVRADGRLEHLGRLDEQIKIRGFRIEPGEIEQVLKEHPAIANAVVAAREVLPGDLRLVAYFVPAAHSPGDAWHGELLELLRRRLPPYMIPSALMPLATLPTTPNGKVDRRALPAPVAHVSLKAGEYHAPRDGLEQQLANQWQYLLGLPRVGIRDDFFMLGGHSLLAVRLFARIEQRMGVTLPLNILFERPTIEYLADAIRQQKAAGRRAGQTESARLASELLVPIKPEGSQPPFFCVHGAGGHVLNLWSLARDLGADQPLYGLQARGIDGRARPLDNLPGMATLYLEEVRTVQPHGPFRLGGYCAGGWVALEMARQLEAQGESVDLVALIDCYHPRLQPPVHPLRNLASGIRQKGLPYLWQRGPASIKRHLSMVTNRVRVAWHQSLGDALPVVLREYWLTRAMMGAAARHVPAPYRGQVLLVRAGTVDPTVRPAGADMGWGKVLLAMDEVVDVPGDHATLLEEPHAATIAAQLLRRLRKPG